MEILSISPGVIRLRGKQVSLLINPTQPKIKGGPVDATLFYYRALEFNTNEIEGNKLTIDGPGEYEVGGVKITGYLAGNEFYYSIVMDGIDTLIGKANTLSKVKSNAKECQIAIIESDVLLDQGIAAAINPSVLVFYGSQAVENVKALGKEDITPVGKFAVTREKLPSETEIVLLQ